MNWGTSPLLTGPDRPAPDLPATDAELAALTDRARRRRASTIAIGSGRTPHATDAARRIAERWEHAGGKVIETVTWPESAASWLRSATRFAAARPDLWVMTGPATGWAQMAARLLWSTAWKPELTLATAALCDLPVLERVGLRLLDGLAGADADGHPWLVSANALLHPLAVKASAAEHQVEPQARPGTFPV